MIEYIIYEPGKICWKELYEYLVEVDDYLLPPLSARVNLEEYAQKLASRATNFIARDNGEIIAFSANYMNKYPEMSFGTYWSIKREYRDSDVAIDFSLMSARYVKAYGTKGIWCIIRKSNKPLVNYYKRLGYKIVDEKKYPNSNIDELVIEKIYRE